MARLPRLTIPGFPHHVIQRGNDRRALFLNVGDRERYLLALREVAAQSGLAVHAYVLMSDHVHLLVSPHAADGVGRALQALGRRYVRWFNDRHRRTGALFEGRYRSTVVDPEHYLLPCMRYIELNPVRAGLVEEPDGYPWSSHRHHVGRVVDPLITDHPVYWALGNTPFERQAAYLRWFERGPTEAELATIRQATRGGWLLGPNESAARLGANRRPWALKPGRPKRTQVCP